MLRGVRVLQQSTAHSSQPLPLDDILSVVEQNWKHEHLHECQVDYRNTTPSGVNNDADRVYCIVYATGDEYVGTTQGSGTLRRPHGRGTCTWNRPDGGASARYTGSWVDGYPEGEGSYEWLAATSSPSSAASVESTYVGTWVRGLPHGAGDRQWLIDADPEDENAPAMTTPRFYSGDWEHGLPHGKGVYSDGHGRMFTGEWIEGRRCGDGTWRDSEASTTVRAATGGTGVARKKVDERAVARGGTHYRGRWKDDVWDGYGSCVYANGDEYKGEWVNGLRHGSGVWIRSNGDRYDGAWQQGLRHGKGIMRWSLSTGAGLSMRITYDGDWLDDLRTGHGRMTWEKDADRAALVYVGGWWRDARHGRGTLSRGRRTVADGEWRSDLLVHGRYHLQDGSGRVYMGPLRAGDVHQVRGRLGLPNGTVYSGDFRGWRVHGRGQLFLPSGACICGTWSRGRPHTAAHGEGDVVVTWAEGADLDAYRGAVGYRGEMNRGKRHGIGSVWFPDGSAYVGEWKNGREHGAGKWKSVSDSSGHDVTSGSAMITVTETAGVWHNGCVKSMHGEHKAVTGGDSASTWCTWPRPDGDIGEQHRLEDIIVDAWVAFLDGRWLPCAVAKPWATGWHRHPRVRMIYTGATCASTGLANGFGELEIRLESGRESDGSVVRTAMWQYTGLWRAGQPCGYGRSVHYNAWPHWALNSTTLVAVLRLAFLRAQSPRKVFAAAKRAVEARLGIRVASPETLSSMYEGVWDAGRRTGTGTCHWYTQVPAGAVISSAAPGSAASSSPSPSASPPSPPLSAVRRYTGHWLRDAPHGSGETVAGTAECAWWRWAHIGQYERGQREGKGAMYYMDGSVYKGRFSEDMRCDPNAGEFRTPEGGTYVGGWKRDKMEGVGLLKLPSLGEYEGDFRDGHVEGSGVMRYEKSGGVYDGMWRHGQPHGHGVWRTSRSGCTYTGVWRKGVPVGEGDIHFSRLCTTIRVHYPDSTDHPSADIGGEIVGSTFDSEMAHTLQLPSGTSELFRRNGRDATVGRSDDVDVLQLRAGFSVAREKALSVGQSVPVSTTDRCTAAAPLSETTSMASSLSNTTCGTSVAHVSKSSSMSTFHAVTSSGGDDVDVNTTAEWMGALCGGQDTEQFLNTAHVHGGGREELRSADAGLDLDVDVDVHGDGLLHELQSAYE